MRIVQAREQFAFGVCEKTLSVFPNMDCISETTPKTLPRNYRLLNNRGHQKHHACFDAVLRVLHYRATSFTRQNFCIPYSIILEKNARDGKSAEAREMKCKTTPKQ
jgi:hypothetical protein